MDKREILLNYDKAQFMMFILCDIEGKIIELLDDEGIEILKNSRISHDRLNYILCYSKYRNEIFKNDKIIDIVLKNVSWYYANMKSLDYDTSLYIFKKSIEADRGSAEIFTYFKDEYKLKILDNWEYSDNLLYSILSKERSFIKQAILDRFNINLSRVNLKGFFADCKGHYLSACSGYNEIKIKIPNGMITTDVCEEIWRYGDIFVIREIINDAGYVTDNNIINSYIKKKEKSLLDNLSNDILVPPINKLYNLFTLMNKYDQEKEYDKYTIIQKLYYETLNRIKMPNIRFDLYNSYIDNGEEGLFNYLKTVSNRYVSNYIIDYFFEENYHNIILDINELLRFIYDGNMSIPLDRLSIYERISNIDSLSIEDKIELCNELKNNNIMELFYDDMLSARNIVGNNIKDNSINSDNISSYRDDDLSIKYGIDIYTDNNEFSAIVKTGVRDNDKLPTGHSFSFVGTNNTGVMTGDITLLYDASLFNPEQLVHTYPRDSFTLYKPFEFSEAPTNRVNNLLTARELLDTTIGYNEILILEQGNEKTDIDDRIPKLKPIAVYCRDTIEEKDIKYAKEHGLGIFLAHTKEKDKSRKLNGYRGDIEYWNYDYYNNGNSDVLEEKRR